MATIGHLSSLTPLMSNQGVPGKKLGFATTVTKGMDLYRNRLNIVRGAIIIDVSTAIPSSTSFAMTLL
jgi:hypothetical protein